MGSQALAGHKRRIPLAVVLPRPARGAGTLIPSVGEGNGNPLQCSCLENPRDWAAWWAAIYGVQETQVQFLGRKDPLEKEMATHSSILTWRIPWTEEPGRLQSMGSQSEGPRHLHRIPRLSEAPWHVLQVLHAGGT